ncbi:hypothetical protein PGT21_031946 [Puccinia graminis f. sp. tritici]|uniref:FAD-binding FR-type domain-containing protein n=1 Tax=Puccinia graminis f. sp. tritici TaxID=56615 RepID=A0A5B0R525_PUCGR|nr:hypothetical protein PGT21_031946 [Puccinia graminis f. sp. tritici]KAA1120617.1 hypothetical protein PGTUg99_010543 [Puccinia graminis f. sp. tritici]
MLSRRTTFYIIWGAIHLFIFIYGWWKQETDQRLAALNKLEYSVWISRGAGLCLCLDGFALFIPVCRNLMHLLRPRIGWLVSVDSNIWFHRQVAYTTLFFTAIHTTAHYVNMFHVETTQIRPEKAIQIMYSETGPLTGHIMLFIMVLMYTTASTKIRTQCFEAFWYTHHLAFFWALCLYTHAAGCFVRGALPDHKSQCLGYNSVYVTVWSGLAYFCDRVFREIRGRGRSEISAVLIHPSGTVEIRMLKAGFKYVPGQWIFFQMPEVSRFQWHPFTISSAPDDPYISIHVRQVGDFTKAVGTRLGATPQLMATLNQPSEFSVEDCGEFHDITTIRSRDLPLVRIDGPYGSPAQDVFKCEVAILIGAGIGVTPFSSILKNIYYMQAQGKLGLLRKVQFIWINKEITSFSWFKTLLKNLEDIQHDYSFLRMDMYLTGSMDEDTISNVVLNTGAHKFDSLTGLKSQTHFGKPHWKKDVFDPIRKSIHSGDWYERDISGTTKVGCFYCGPRPLAKTLEQECRQATTDKVKFEFHKERF